MTERINSRLAFIPGEAINRALFEILSDEMADQVATADVPLGFYSIRSYIRDGATPDMTLRTFKNRVEGSYVSLYPAVAGKRWMYPGNDGVPRQGFEIQVAADFSEDEDAARQVSHLGFADANNLVAAKLTLSAEQLASTDDDYETSIDTIRAIIASRTWSDEQLAEVAIVERKLTDGQ